MDERTRKWVFRILFAIGIVIKVAAWIAIIFAMLCIVNGNKWGMIALFAVGVLGLFTAEGWLTAVEERMG